MAIHITDPETEAAVRKLAALKRTTLTEAIRAACAREVAEIEADRRKREENVRTILVEFDRLPRMT